MADIPGANNHIFTPTEDQLGKRLRLRVRATGPGGVSQWVYSNWSLPVVETDPGVVALRQATGSWYDAKSYVDGQIPSRINVADIATLGSSSDSDASDPRFLNYTGTPYVHVPSAIGNYIRSTEGTPVSTVSVVEMAVRLSDLIITTSDRHLMGGQSTQYSFLLQGATLGNMRPQINIYTGSTFIGGFNGRSINPIPIEVLTPGNKVWLRARITLSSALCEFWYSLDDTNDYDQVQNWISLGTPRAGDNAGATPVGLSNDRQVGAASVGIAGQTANYYAAAWNINGEPNTRWKASDIDTSNNYDAGQSSFISDGLTWSINRATSGYKTAVVTRSTILMDGVDDYIQLPTTDAPTFTATTGKHTVIAAVRCPTAPSGYQRVWSSESLSLKGAWIIYDQDAGGRWSIGVGGTGTSSRNFSLNPLGSTTVVALVVDEGTLRGYRDGAGLSASTPITSLGEIPHAASPRVAARPDAISSPFSQEVLAVRSYPGVALTEAELNIISDVLKRGVYQ